MHLHRSVAALLLAPLLMAQAAPPAAITDVGSPVLVPIAIEFNAEPQTTTGAAVLLSQQANVIGAACIVDRANGKADVGGLKLVSLAAVVTSEAHSARVNTTASRSARSPSAARQAGSPTITAWIGIDEGTPPIRRAAAFPPPPRSSGWPVGRVRLR